MTTGWTWLSFNVDAVDMSIGGVFSDVATLVNGDSIKSQSTFTEYYDGYGFFGQLTTFTTDEMYAVKLATPASVTISGLLVALPKTISLSSGWSWIPCPYESAVPLSSGAPTFGYAQGDQYKSQSSFSEFYDGYGWFGTLLELSPGTGYRVKVATGGSASFSL